MKTAQHFGWMRVSPLAPDKSHQQGPWVLPVQSLQKPRHLASKRGNAWRSHSPAFCVSKTMLKPRLPWDCTLCWQDVPGHCSQTQQLCPSQASREPGCPAWQQWALPNTRRGAPETPCPCSLWAGLAWPCVWPLAHNTGGAPSCLL